MAGSSLAVGTQLLSLCIQLELTFVGWGGRPKGEPAKVHAIWACSAFLILNREYLILNFESCFLNL